jgi:hypothetical protein
MQIDIEEKSLLMGEMRSPALKKILYNFKVAYYTFNKLQRAVPRERTNDKEPDGAMRDLKEEMLSPEEISLIEQLIEYGYNHYEAERLILLFHSGSDQRIVNIAERLGFNTIVFPEEKEKSWGVSVSDVSHWTCEGHKEAAEIISKEIFSLMY